MSTESNLWVLPRQLNPLYVLENIDPGDTELLQEYESALAACQSASQLLWALSGRKFHSGTIATERYIVNHNYAPGLSLRRATGMYVVDRYSVFMVDPVDYLKNQIVLAGRPVRAIGNVLDITSGEEISPSGYSVINKSILKFTQIPFGGIEVSYTYGVPVPALGKLAALHLARNFFLIWSGREGECDLPERVTSVTRQGVSWVLADNQQYIDDLRTGVYIVDIFLRSVNPARATQKAKVFSVDMPRGERRSL